MIIVKPNCFEKTKVRWGIFKKLSPTKIHSEQSAPLAANYDYPPYYLGSVDTEFEECELEKTEFTIEKSPLFGTFLFEFFISNLNNINKSGHE